MCHCGEEWCCLTCLSLCWDGQCLALQPRLLVALQNRATALMSLKRHTEALADLDGVPAKERDAGHWLLVASCLRVLHRYQEAYEAAGTSLALESSLKAQVRQPLECRVNSCRALDAKAYDACLWRFESCPGSFCTRTFIQSSILSILSRCECTSARCGVFRRLAWRASSSPSPSSSTARPLRRRSRCLPGECDLRSEHAWTDREADECLALTQC